MAQFGDFNRICKTVALTVCPLVGTSLGLEPACYSRSIELQGTLIFQPGKADKLGNVEPEQLAISHK